jgi:hypothetical protein
MNKENTQSQPTGTQGKTSNNTSTTTTNTQNKTRILSPMTGALSGPTALDPAPPTYSGKVIRAELPAHAFCTSRTLDASGF